MNILITGAVRGIGYQTALSLLRRGHNVYLSVHTEEQLERLKKRKELQVKNVKLLKLDITDEKDLNKIKKLDIDVLINNATMGIGGSIIERSINEIKDNYEVNVFSTIELSKMFLNKMIDKDKGRIIMITSIAAEVTYPFLGIYASTKAAIKSLTLALIKELKIIKSKVKVIIVEPGLYHTGHNQDMLKNKYDNKRSIFSKVRYKIKLKENIEIGILEHYNLSSIVNKIVKAVEDIEPKDIYKAPFIHSLFGKFYGLIKK